MSITITINMITIGGQNVSIKYPWKNHEIQVGLQLTVITFCRDDA